MNKFVWGLLLLAGIGAGFFWGRPALEAVPGSAWAARGNLPNFRVRTCCENMVVLMATRYSQQTSGSPAWSGRRVVSIEQVPGGTGFKAVLASE